jgi:hypothetical protein
MQDPLFWQALGRTLDWEENNEEAEWFEHSMKYHELILTEQSTDEFWNKLLGSKYPELLAEPEN